MRLRVAGLFGFAVASCTAGDAASPSRAQPAIASGRDFASGTRLRARVQRIEGLVDVLAAWHDTALDADCLFVDELGPHAGAGAKYSCVPTSIARHREVTGPFADGACTERVGLVTPGESPAFVLVEPRDACAGGPLVYRAGTRADGRAPYVRDEAGGCARASAKASWVGLGDRVDDVVRAVETVSGRDGPIAARELVASDGARQVLGGWDTQRSVPVTASVAEDGLLRWLPSRLAFAGGGEERFMDAFCTLPVATKIARDALCPLSNAFVFTDACGRGGFRELGAALDVASTFARDASGACVKSPPSSIRAFSIGAPIAANAFFEAERVEIGLGPVRRRAISAFSGGVVVRGDPVDARTGEPCVVTSLAGALRCAPAPRVAATFFADAACTEVAFVDAVDACANAPLPLAVRSLDDPPKVYATGRALDVVYDASCKRLRVPADARAFALLPLDPSTLPRAEEHIE